MLSVSVDVIVSGAALVDITKPIDQNLQVSASVAPNLTLVQPLSQNLSVTANTSGLIDVNKQLDQNLRAVATAAPDLTVVVEQQASVSVSSTTTANLQQIVDLEAIAIASTATSFVLDLVIDLDSIAQAIATVSGNASQIIALFGDILVDTDINLVGNSLASSVAVEARVAPLLDVDGNTFGSPGGESIAGFFPPNSLIFASHSESAPEQTYSITADFSEDADIVTEVVEVDFDDNPAEVLAYSFTGNVVQITARTPREVYAESSTFLVKRELEPILGIPVDYRVRFNTVVKQSRSGNNFFSNKFYNDTGDICFLRDDGKGLIQLWEENIPGSQLFLKEVGKINYDTGEVEVRILHIKGKFESNIFFTVESVNNVIPTSDYFNQQNSTIVQSKTITFPTGEQVEISQYEKSSDIVNINIYIRARSFNINNPSVTLEEREAIYKMTILPDYDLGKQRLMQLIAEEV